MTLHKIQVFCIRWIGKVVQGFDLMQIRGEEGEMTLVLFNVDDDDEDETRKKGEEE